jgi:hypothetical protein
VLTDNGVTIATLSLPPSGIVNFTTNSLTVGGSPHAITATYSGDSTSWRSTMVI